MCPCEYFFFVCVRPDSPRRLSANLGGLPGGRGGGLGPHGLADGVDLRLAGGEVVHELLVLHNQLLDLLGVVGQGLLLQVRQDLLSTQQPLHQLVKETQQVLQLLQVLLKSSGQIWSGLGTLRSTHRCGHNLALK